MHIITVQSSNPSPKYFCKWNIYLYSSENPIWMILLVLSLSKLNEYKIPWLRKWLNKPWYILQWNITQKGATDTCNYAGGAWLCCKSEGSETKMFAYSIIPFQGSSSHFIQIAVGNFWFLNNGIFSYLNWGSRYTIIHLLKLIGQHKKGKNFIACIT